LAAALGKDAEAREATALAEEIQRAFNAPARPETDDAPQESDDEHGTDAAG